MHNHLAIIRSNDINIAEDRIPLSSISATGNYKLKSILSAIDGNIIEPLSISIDTTNSLIKIQPSKIYKKRIIDNAVVDDVIVKSIHPLNGIAIDTVLSTLNYTNGTVIGNLDSSVGTLPLSLNQNDYFYLGLELRSDNKIYPKYSEINGTLGSIQWTNSEPVIKLGVIKIQSNSSTAVSTWSSSLEILSVIEFNTSGGGEGGELTPASVSSKTGGTASSVSKSGSDYIIGLRGGIVTTPNNKFVATNNLADIQINISNLISNPIDNTRYWMYIDLETCNTNTLTGDNGGIVAYIAANETNFVISDESPFYLDKERFVYCTDLFYTVVDGWTAESFLGREFLPNPRIGFSTGEIKLGKTERTKVVIEETTNSIFAHDLPNLVSIAAYYTDSSNNTTPVELSSIISNFNNSTITISTGSLVFSNGENLTLYLEFQPADTTELADIYSSLPANTEVIDNISITSIANPLGMNLTYFKLIEEDYALGIKREVNPYNIVSFDSENIYFEWNEDNQPTSTKKYYFKYFDSAESMLNSHTDLITDYEVSENGYQTISEAVLNAPSGSNIIVAKSYTTSEEELINKDNITIIFVDGVKVTTESSANGITISGNGCELIKPNIHIAGSGINKVINITGSRNVIDNAAIRNASTPLEHVVNMEGNANHFTGSYYSSTDVVPNTDYINNVIDTDGNYYRVRHDQGVAFNHVGEGIVEGFIAFHTPENLTPTEGTIITSDTIELIASDYINNTGVAHQLSYFKVATDINMVNTVYTGSTSSGSLTRHTVNGLTNGGTFYWSVKYIDVLNNESSWSTPTSFSTEENLVSKPTNISPLEGADVVASNLTLQSGVYQDNYNYVHAKTYVRIATDTGFTNIVYTGETTTGDLKQHLVNVLEPETTYYWQVKYENSEGVQSEWSNYSSFDSTQLFINTPSNISPVDSSVGLVPGAAVLIGSTYISNYNYAHVKSYFEVYRDSGLTELAYSGESTSGNLHRCFVPELDYATTYYWRVRYENSLGDISSWSSITSFSTANVVFNAPEIIESPLTIQRGTPIVLESTLADIDGVSKEEHISTDWELLNSSNQVIAVNNDTIFSLTSVAFDNVASLPVGSYKIRARFNGSADVSAYSDILTFDIAEISTPTINSPTGTVEINRGLALNITSSAMDISTTGEEHSFTDWTISDESDNVIKQYLIDQTNKTSLEINLDELNLKTGNYKVKTQYIGTVDQSEEADEVAFSIT